MGFVVKVFFAGIAGVVGITLGGILGSEMKRKHEEYREEEKRKEEKNKTIILPSDEK